MSDIQFMVIKDGKPSAITATETLRLLTTLEVGPILEGTEPVVGTPPAQEPKQVFGHPRTLIGYRPNGNPVYTGTGINYLLEVVGTDPDQFLPRGVNIEVTLKEGVKRPTGVETPWGVGTPIGFTTPAGYRMDKYDDGAKYYTQL